MGLAASPLVAATAQSACLGMASSILAQALAAYNESSGKGVREMSLTVDWLPVMQYLLYIVVSTPPNFMWQQLLESSFPAYPSPPINASSKPNGASSKPESKPTDSSPTPPSKSNTLIKLLLDQTLSAAANTLLYSIFTHALRAASHPQPVLADPLAALRFLLLPSSSHSITPGARGIGGGTSAGVDFSRVRWDAVWQAAAAEFWPMLLAGLRLWPLVSLLNFSLIKSVQGRNLLGGVAGLGWGVYVCLAAGK